MSAHLSANVNTSVRPRIYVVSMDLTIVLSTDIQNWQEFDVFQRLNLTARYELIDMSQYHKSYQIQGSHGALSFTGSPLYLGSELNDKLCL
jgi:hypothetical protein